MLLPGGIVKAIFVAEGGEQRAEGQAMENSPSGSMLIALCSLPSALCSPPSAFFLLTFLIAFRFEFLSTDIYLHFFGAQKPRWRFHSSTRQLVGRPWVANRRPRIAGGVFPRGWSTIRGRREFLSSAPPVSHERQSDQVLPLPVAGERLEEGRKRARTPVALERRAKGLPVRSTRTTVKLSKNGCAAAHRRT